MQRLFWKIFFWFWTAMLILTAGVAWTTYEMRDIEGENVMGQAYREFRQHSHEAVLVLQQQGLEGLQKWYDSGRHRKYTQLFVIGIDGQQRLGKTIPPRIKRFLGPGMRTPEGYTPHWIITQLVQPPNDMPYQVITTFRRPHPLTLLFTPSRILIALVISGLVCFWLARHITRPITRLRLATQKLTAGDLDVRVANELGRRHDELAALAIDFDRMAEQLQALVQSQQHLIRDVSHELRSPLARLQVALELARQRGNGQVEDELNRIELEAERLNELIGQVLSLARMETGARPLNRRPTDMKQLIETIVGDAHYEAQSNQRQVILVSADARVLNIDETLIHSAIENIIRNAIKNTAKNTTVEVTLVANRDTVKIAIRDHGPGISNDRLKDIFQPFVRLSEARDRNSGGYGLGLAIANRAIRLHKGKIIAENCTTGGLLLTITLPIETAV